MKICYLPNEYSQQRQREKKRFIYPVHLAMEAEYYRKLGHEVIWGHFEDCQKVVTEIERLPFDKLPWPDRIFTNAFDKRYQNNGNFKYRPGTYIQSASGCWHGKCSFCVETKSNWVVRDFNDVYEEIVHCRGFGFREIFDDSGTFPVGTWLNNFLKTPPPGITLGCNMRMVDVDYSKMKAFGFRMLLFGIESANQGTLNRINKGVKVEDFKWILKASQAGLDCHGAFMFGYPWESDQDSINTLELAHMLLRKGYLKTAQASFYTPPDGMNNPHHKKYVSKLYDVAYYPDFWFNQLKDLRNFSDVKYLFRKIKEGICGRN